MPARVPSKLTMLWNFAFGSHLSESQLAKISGGLPLRSFRATLRDYRLTFWKVLAFPEGFSRLASGGSAVLVPEKSSMVYGVVYEISDVQWERLDAYERAWKYEAVEFLVYAEGIGSITARAHNRVDLAESTPPSQEFLDLMTTGARQHGYSQDMIEEIKKAAAAP